MRESLATHDDLAALAPIPLTREEGGTFREGDVPNEVPRRMQTEHLYAIEKHLAAQGLHEDLVEEVFFNLHRCRPMQRPDWLTMVTNTYNLALALAEQEQH